jgi:acetyl-CoA acetyltransferase
MQQNAYIAGVGMTTFAKHQDRTLKSLTQEAVGIALQDSGLEVKDLEAAYFGTAAAAVTVGQVMVLGQVALCEMGIGRIPVVNVENACASAATAFQQACTMVTVGLYDVVLAIGSEKLDCEGKQKTFSVFTRAVDFESFDEVSADLYKRIKATSIDTDEDGAGSNRSLFMDIYAAMALGHMRDYGTTREDFAAVSAKTSFHGSLNPKAQFQQELSVDEVLNAREISYPLTLTMCSPIGDGSAVAVIVSEKIAKRLGTNNMVNKTSVLRSGWDIGEDEVLPKCSRKRRTNRRTSAPKTST